MDRLVVPALVLAAALLTAASAGCSGTSSDTGDTAPDATIGDSADVSTADLTTDLPGDTPGADVPADLPHDAPADAAPDAAGDAALEVSSDSLQEVAPDGADSGEPTDLVAVPGERCAPGERIGLVSVYSESYDPDSLNGSAAISDRPHPLAPLEPKLSDAVCGFFQQPPVGFCDDCGPEAVCAPDDTCKPLPVPATDIVLTVLAGDESQTFESKGSPSGVWGPLTLPGRTFSATVTWAGNTLTVPEMTVPLALDGAAGTLAGGLDEPTGLDLTWTPPEDAGLVFTSIPINHHAGGQTFTQCAGDASTGTLHVDGDMLKPLAVSTGLEFQGIEHARFAAAHTPAGCIEVRFHVYQMVDLKY